MSEKLNRYIRIKHGYAFESRFFADTGEYIVLTPGNFRESGGFRSANGMTKFYSGDIPADYVLSKNDLLVAMTEQAPGLLGAPALVPDDNRYLHNQRLGLVELLDGNLLDKDYLFHLFCLPTLRQKIEKTAAGTKVRHTSPDKIVDVEVFIPSLSEQKYIASTLSAWNSAIEIIERLIDHKSASFSCLLDRLIRKPSHHWRSMDLSGVVEPVTRKNSIGETNVLTSSAEFGLISQLEYYNKSVSAEDVSSYYLLNKGEFAYNRSSAKGYPYGAIKRLDRYETGVLSTLYLCFRIKENVDCDPDFLLFLFESGCLNTQLAEICQEGARSHGLLNISKTDFFALGVNIPDLAEQRKIAKALATAREEIVMLRKQSELLSQEKSFLMSKLLTGEWDASDPGAEAKR